MNPAFQDVKAAATIKKLLGVKKRGSVGCWQSGD
jgi:hypothetical protein